MSTSHITLKQQTSLQGQAVASLSFEWLMAACVLLRVFGSYLDLWAHTHIPQLETFFTPWHAVLYGSFALTAAVLIGATVLNHYKGYSWMEAIPRGYDLALLGVGIFLIGGFSDMLWHIAFGIERSIDALLSPTDLLLALGGFFISTGPLRSAWIRSRSEELHGWRTLGPMIVSLFALLAALVFFTWYVHPFTFPYAAFKGSSSLIFFTQALGVASILLQSIFLMGPVLLIVRRWHLPFGALTLVFVLVTITASVPRDTYYFVPVGLLAGLGADLLLQRLSMKQDTTFRLFAFLVPVLLYTLYFIELAILAGITWTIHMWMGAIVLSGVMSLLLSYLLVQPRILENKAQ